MNISFLSMASVGQKKSRKILTVGTSIQVLKLANILNFPSRIAAVPSFPGLRRFKEGRNFEQWTGDDSKVLMKVWLKKFVLHNEVDLGSRFFSHALSATFPLEWSNVWPPFSTFATLHSRTLTRVMTSTNWMKPWPTFMSIERCSLMLVFASISLSLNSTLSSTIDE